MLLETGSFEKVEAELVKFERRVPHLKCFGEASHLSLVVSKYRFILGEGKQGKFSK